MILISGVLVFLAAGLLVDGVFFTGDQAGTPWQIWVSIGVSAGAAALLVAGALRERGRRPQVAGADDGPGAATVAAETIRIARPAEPPAAPAAGSLPAGTDAPPPAESRSPAVAGAALAAGVEVLVVPGRPRYHVAGCRYLEGRGPQPLEVGEARTAGYTPCGACRPDEAIAGAGPAVPAPPVQDGPVGPASAVTGAPGPGEVAPASASVAPVAAGPSAEAADETVDEAEEALDEAEEAADVPVAAAAGPPVVLVRGRYHRPDCRYVSVATESREVSRAAARAEGALPCGVCLP
ncbi:MAG: hypothetical protein ACJ74O_07535 [Frankiaceae bacterium]